MANGWTQFTARGGYGGMTVKATLAPQAAATVNCGAAESVDGAPLLLVARCIVTINNVANATASAFAVQAPFPSFGGFTVIIEPSLNDTNWPGVNYVAAAGVLTTYELTGLYTNLMHFGGVGYQGSQVNQALAAFAPWTLTNLNPLGGKSFDYFIAGFLTAHPLLSGDQGGGVFE